MSISQPQYASVPTHGRAPSVTMDDDIPDSPTGTSQQHRRVSSYDDMSDAPPRSSFVSPLPAGAQMPFMPAAARASVASSLGQYGYPSAPTPGGASTPAYRTSEYSSSMRALNPPGPMGYRDEMSQSSPYLGGAGTPYTDDGSKPGTPMIPLGASRSDEIDGVGHEYQNMGRGMGLGMSEKPRPYAATRKRRGWLWCLGILAIIGIVALAVIIPIYFLVIKPHQTSSSASSGSGSGSGGGNSGSNGGGNSGGQSTQPAPLFTGAISGGDGSTVTKDDGSTFTYSNAFGGTWYFDPSDPFNDGAQAQSWTPRLNESWQFGIDQIRGVNLGGWLVTEPFICPNLYEPYQDGDFASPYNAVDEWTLNVAMNKSGNVTAMMEDHYATFITEEDFAAIAAAGLNWVRIPIPYWALDTYPGEPFVPKLAWTYFLKAIEWARKYGLRINMDLHTIPGSQNGWNHSGKLGPVNFLFGVMGISNAQRALSYIRTLTEFVSQPEYKNVVPFFGIVNEALLTTIGQPQLQSFYLEAHDMIRNITGLGEGNGPFISIHDGFIDMSNWAGYMSGSDRVAMDTHPYNAFNPATTEPLSSFIPSPCQSWGPEVNNSMNQFGFTAAGEWSAAINDCGKWVNGVGLGTRYEATYPGSTNQPIGSCSTWTDYESWDQTTIDQTKELVMSTMDALQNWFFWTWKINNSTVTGKIESPSWSYSLGLAQGWIPADPRDAVGYCAASAGVAMTVPVNGLQSWQTGGEGAGTIAAAQIASFGVWPITAMNSVSTLSYLPPASVAILPQYTPTGAIISLEGPTFTTPGSTQTADAGSGWANSGDTQGYFVAIEGCPYPDPWNAQTTTIPPAGLCQPTQARMAKRDPEPAPVAMPTAPPVFRAVRQ